MSYKTKASPENIRKNNKEGWSSETIEHNLPRSVLLQGVRGRLARDSDVYPHAAGLPIE